MVCPMCRKYYFRVEVPKDVWNNFDDEWCPKCISDQYESDQARYRAKRIYYSKELVVIGRAEFECSGYYLEGDLYDEEMMLAGREMYGLLSYNMSERISIEIIRRIETKAILKECEEIEKALPTSKNPAKLRLRRSDLDGQLEKLEATV